jgi:crossover junction endodeoxyribonuclease RusA
MSYTEAALTHLLKRNPGVQIVGAPRTTCRTACTLLLPWPPTLNHYRAVSSNRLVTTQAGKDYRRAVAHAVQVQRQGQPPYRERLHLELDYHAPYPDDRYDLDNFQKALLDALTHAGIWEDDKQIACYRPRKRPSSTPGYVAMVIDLCAHQPCCWD